MMNQRENRQENWADQETWGQLMNILLLCADSDKAYLKNILHIFLKFHCLQ